LGEIVIFSEAKAKLRYLL